jgi:hypothetical protein
VWHQLVGGEIQAPPAGSAPAGEFDTKNKAMSYMRGFTIGFAAGGGIKNMADGLPSRLT